ARIAEERFATRVLEEVERDRAFMALAGPQRNEVGLALRVHESVDFCRKAASRASQSISLAPPPFPPHASWWAQTIEASTIAPSSSSSVSIDSVANNNSQMPSSDQLRKRL